MRFVRLPWVRLTNVDDEHLNVFISEGSMKTVQLGDVVDEDRGRQAAELEDNVLFASKVTQPHGLAVQIGDGEFGRDVSDVQGRLKVELRQVKEAAIFLAAV
jgi:uncharacterized protein YwbE